MVVGKPTDCALWAKVEPLITWPVSDEDNWTTCSLAWTNAGGSFVETAGHAGPVDADLASGWPDQAGQDYRTQAAALYRTTNDVGERMKHAGWLAGQYADDVKYAKTQIAQVVRANEATFEHDTRFFFFPDNAARNALARTLAVGINGFLDQMAARIRARGTGEDLSRPEFPKTTANNWQIVPPPHNTSRGGDKPERGTVDESEKTFNAREKRIADLLADEGKDVKALKEIENSGSRNPDALVDGVQTEFKTVDGAGDNTIKNLLDKSAKRGGQARDIILDARDVPLTEEAAQSGIMRHLGNGGNAYDHIRIIGQGFDISWP